MSGYHKDVKTLLDFVGAAQTILAVFNAPGDAKDSDRCCEILSDLLDSKPLLEAQLRLNDVPGHVLVMLEQTDPPTVL